MSTLRQLRNFWTLGITTVVLTCLPSSILLADPTGGRMTLAVMPGGFHAGSLKTHELLDARGDFVDGPFGDFAAVSGVGDRLVDWPPAHLQIVHPCTSD